MIEGSKILLVDDNVDIVDAISDFLTLNGCSVLAASTGKEAMELLNKNDIEVVILDVRLPDTNGVALLDTIKINNPTVAVVMVTGYYNPNYVVEAMKKGASDFLIKPFEFDKLVLVLIRALRERSLLIEKENIYQTLEDKKKIELLNRELQKKIKELTTMYQISNQFNSLTIFNDVYEKMLNIVYDALEVKSCGYYIFDGKNKELILYKEKTNNNGSMLESRIPASGDFLEHLRSQKKYLSKNNELYLPINIKGECIGFIMVDSKRNGLRKDDHLLDSDIFFLKLIAEKASTQIENRMLYESLFENVFQTLTSLIAAINKRDSYTESHCHRVTDMTMLLADKMDLPDYEKDVLRFVGPVHDLGKIGVPDSILLKPGALSDEEYNIMKSHSAFGEEILSRFDILSKEAKIIRSHHERYDGRGYPDTLVNDGIPICSRVIAVCDTYDAMVTNRPYRKALEKEYTLNEIERCKGSQFDPDIAACFIEMARDDMHGKE
ncbi:MAG: response regulator [Proteobacteria bacterium]|nr:response regulator [Pseudomonadota bacterium]